ncbi:MAG: hypothetical protein IBJ16_03410 [Chitinophagaceae bacterium]|nr:hypothetical protein [Chitinophagaceae bacterium]
MAQVAKTPVYLAPEEFYAVAFRKKLYHTIEEMQKDFDEWMLYEKYPTA